MIRAVLDTNLIVSYLLSAGETMTRLIDHWEQNHFVYLISPTILHELKDVLSRPRLHRYLKGDPGILIELIEADAEMVPGILSLAGVCRDPKDDQFIACAVEGQATYLVTGDADLLDMSSYQNITMIRAFDFVELLDKTEV